MNVHSAVTTSTHHLLQQQHEIQSCNMTTLTALSSINQSTKWLYMVANKGSHF